MHDHDEDFSQEQIEKIEQHAKKMFTSFREAKQLSDEQMRQLERDVGELFGRLKEMNESGELGRRLAQRASIRDVVDALDTVSERLSDNPQLGRSKSKEIQVKLDEIRNAFAIKGLSADTITIAEYGRVISDIVFKIQDQQAFDLLMDTTGIIARDCFGD